MCCYRSDCSNFSVYRWRMLGSDRLLYKCMFLERGRVIVQLNKIIICFHIRIWAFPYFCGGDFRHVTFTGLSWSGMALTGLLLFSPLSVVWSSVVWNSFFFLNIFLKTTTWAVTLAVLQSAYFPQEDTYSGNFDLPCTQVYAHVVKAIWCVFTNNVATEFHQALWGKVEPNQ